MYLYVKQHNVTGLKYFGMTSTKDPYVYVGSGTHWRRHLRVHGKDIVTLEVWEFSNQDDCEKFALEFSEKNNIVESKEWANLRPENGRDGKPVGSPGMKGEKNPQFGKTGTLNTFYGKKHTPENILLFKNRPKLQGGQNPRAKKVTTPNGKFECLEAAAKNHNVTTDTVRARLKKQLSGYYWGWVNEAE
jgi:hypothetical protein